MWVSVGISQLHASIPHHHHDDLTAELHQEEHESAESLIEIIALLFHLEVADEDLESIVPAHRTTNFAVFACLCSICIPNVVAWLFRYSSQCLSHLYHTNYLHSGYTSCLSLRGPPAL
jgi:hypothetical protein